MLGENRAVTRRTGASWFETTHCVGLLTMRGEPLLAATPELILHGEEW
jgi:hypothetical protein